MTDQSDYRTEFERAMRGARRRIQERQTPSKGETNEPIWSDVETERSER